MKHTTFENELRDIRRKAIQELKEAINAHGDTVIFNKEVELHKLEGEIGWIKEDGTILVYIPTAEGVLHAKWFNAFNDLSIEDILSIIEAIPETDEVKDVSGVYPVPITWVDLDDIEMQGFKTDGMTQKDLQKLADEMCDIYNNGDFCSDLDLACKNIGLKEKED